MPSRPKSVKAMAQELKSTLVAMRRDLHMYPELGFQEFRTGAKVASLLTELGVDVRTKVGKTGVVGLLRGSRRGKTVALRADMDALPIQEANDAPYRSRNAGVMHACGHDAHTAMLLGAATILSRIKSRVRGSVKFFFQPAEEIISGAPAMIRDGALERPKPGAIFGVHVTPDMPFGAVGVTPGARMAATNHFRITVSGQGGHGAHPSDTRDPLVAAHQIYQAVQTLRREVYSFEPYVISICSFHGGTTYNIIPHDAEIRGTLRTFKDKVRRQLQRRLRDIVKGAAETFRADARLFFDVGCPSLVNDEALCALAHSAAKRLRMPIRDKDPTMGGEDFAYYAERIPGAFIRIGTQRGKKPRIGHSNTFDIDENVLPLGAAVYAQCALEYLGEG